MTARAARRPLRSRLALTTALAGLALPIGAAAQTTVTGFGTYTTTPTSAEAGAAAPTISSPSSTQLDVTLNAKNTIVNWNDLNVPQGSTANFSNNGTTTTGATAVLNRVTVVGAGNTTTLGGTITADHDATNQVQVWFINPNGILVGNGASLNTAGLVLSTLDLTSDGDFLNGGTGGLYSVNLAGASSTASITGGDLTTTIATNNGILALVAPTIGVTAAMNSGRGPTAFALATDVSLQTTVGGPLSITLNAGTTLGGSVAGTILGDRVYALLRPDTVTGNLLAVDASVTHATLDATGAVVLSGDSQTVSFANGDALSTGATAAGVASDARLGAVSIGTSGATSAAVRVDASGTATLAGVIDGVNTVTATGGGGIQLSAPTITSTGAQSYVSAVTLLGDVSLMAGAGAVGFAGTIDSDASARALTITSTGTTSFDSLIGTSAALASLSSTGGTTAFTAAGARVAAPSVRTVGAQTYDAVALGADTTFTSSTGGASFGAITGSGRALRLSLAGATTLAGVGTVADPLASLASDGAATLGGSVYTSGNQTYTGAVTLTGGSAIRLDAGTTGMIAFAGAVDGAADLTLAGNVTAASGLGATSALTSLTTTAALGLTGNVATSGTQTYGGTLTIAGDATLSGTTASFTGAYGVRPALAGSGNLTLRFTGAQALDGGSFTDGTDGFASLTIGPTGGTTGATTNLTGGFVTSSALTVNDAATLTGNVTLATGAGGVAFNTTLNSDASARTLAITTAGPTLFAASVGAATNGALGSLAAGTGPVTVGTATSGAVSITTTGAQSYTGAVTLATAATLSAGGTGFIFSGFTGGGNDLTLTGTVATATKAIDGSFTGLRNFATTGIGTTTLNGSVTTTGFQSYGDPVTLAGATSLSAGGTGFIFSGVTGAGNDLTLNGTASTATKVIDGTFTGIRNLATTGSGTTTLNGSVTTTGFQSYGDPVTLAGATTLSAGGTGFTFVGVMGAGFDLTLTGTATTATKTIDGGFTGIRNLATTGSGSTALSGTVSTTGTQSYGDAVMLAADVTLASSGAGSGGDIGFGGTLAGAHALTVATMGTASFGGVVGGTVGGGQGLTSLAVSTGPTRIGGASIYTTGAQSYTGAVALGVDTTLTAATVAFAAGINGNDGTRDHDLTLATTGVRTIDGSDVGLRNLTVGGGGGTMLSGAVTTSGVQGYGDAVMLAGATTLSAGGTGFTFNGVAGAGFDLTLTGTATTATKAIDGGFTAIRNLATTGIGSTTLSGTVATTGYQSYGDPVMLAGATTLSAGGTGFAFSGVTGAGFDLTLTGTATTATKAIDGTFTGIRNLATTGSGTTTLAGAVTTTGFQRYGDAVTLAATTTLSAGGTGFTFSGVMGGGFDLILTGTATTATKVIDGGFTGIRNLATTGIGTTTLDGAVTTSGYQNYGDPVTLTGTTTLSAGGTGFTFSGVAGAGNDLTLTGTASTATKVINGGFIGIRNLATAGIGTTTLNGAVTTSGYQNYGDPVTLTGTTTLSAGGTGFTFSGVAGAGNDLTLTGTASTATKAIDGGFTGIRNLATTGVGTTTLSGAVTTSGYQNYGDAVTLAGTTTLSAGGTGFTFRGVTGGGFDLTLTGTASTAIKAISGGFAGIRNLATTGIGTTTLNGAVTTSGFQSYGDPVALAGTTTLSAAGTGFTFSGVAGAGNDLTLTGTASTATKVIDGGFTGIRNLTTTGIGTTTLNGAVTTSGFQNYGDPATLAGATTLSAGGTGFTFSGVAGAGNDLTLTGTAATATKAIDGTFTGIRNLATTGVGTTTLSGAVTTSGYQNYGDPVTLAGTTTLSAGGTGFTFRGVTGDGFDLTLTGTASTAIKAIGGGFAGIRNLAITGIGTTTLAGTVATSGTQGYGDATTLAADATLSSSGAGAIGFASTLDGGHALAIATAGMTSFGGAVGRAQPLTSLAVSTGATRIAGGSIRTTAGQSYAGAVTLAADTMLTGATVAFAAGINGNDGTRDHDLTLSTTGPKTIDGGFAGIRNLTATGGGATTLDGTVTTSGSQRYDDAVRLAAAATRVVAGTGAVTFNATVDAASAGVQALAVSTTGTTTFAGAVGGAARLASLTTSAGPVVLGAASVATTGAQSYAGAVTLGAPAVALSANGGGAVTFAGTLAGAGSGSNALTVTTTGLTTLGGAVGGGSGALASLSIDGGGATAVNGGSVTTTGGQAYGGTVTIVGDATLNASTGSFTGAYGVRPATDDTGSLTLNFTAPQALSGGTFTDGTHGFANFTLGPVGGTAGATKTLDAGFVVANAASFNDAVALGGDVTVRAGTGGVAFANTIDAMTAGVQGLSVTTAGTTTFGSPVGNSVRLASLATSAGPVALNAGSVRTTGNQSYGGAVTLGVDTILDASTGAAPATIAFAATVDGARSLTVIADGIRSFAGSVGAVTALGSLTSRGAATAATGATAFGAGAAVVRTAAAMGSSGGQRYGGAVTLGRDVVFSGVDGGFGALTGNAHALTLSFGGATTLSTVGGVTSLASDGGGTTTLTGNVATSATQRYEDDVVLGASVALTSAGAGAAGNVAFAGTIDAAGAGAQALTVTTAGTTSFGGRVGAMAALASLAAGTTLFAIPTPAMAASVITTGAQSYGATTVALDAVLTGGSVSFAGSVDGAMEGGQALTVNASGVATFNGAVGAGMALASLTTDAGGTTSINGGLVRTTGAQTYNDRVTLGAATVLTGTTGVFAAGLIGNNYDLTLNFSGMSTLDGSITGVRNLMTDAAGTTILNGALTTSGSQIYNDRVTLGSAAALTSSGNAAITFAATLDGSQSLAVNTGGVTTFGGAVGSTTALASLATDAGGTTQLNGGSVSTTGGQSYGDAVSLGAETVLSSSGSGIIGFASTLDGAQSLVVNTGGSTLFGGAVGGVAALASLATDAGGTTLINGGLVRTTGSQGYGDAVTLGASAVLSSSGGGMIGFATTVNAASAGVQSLAVNTGGVTTFGGAVGSTTALASLATDAGGTTQLNGGSVLTTSGQSYGDVVTLGAATVLSLSGVGTIGFASTLDGAQSLVVNTGGSTVFGGAVGGVTALASLATDAGGTTSINGGLVRTTGSQGYGDAVTLGASAVLSSSGGGTIGFATTVNAASAGVQSLAVNTGGVTTFGGRVGSTTALASLATDAGGTTQLNGGSVLTTSGQSYGDAVALGAATVLSSSGSGIIGFASTLDGAQSLVVNTGGSTLFGGAVGGVAALASLATDAGGTTLINGGLVRTTGSQGYGDAVTLGASAVLSSSGGGMIGFATTVNAASAGVQSLAVNTGGVTTFGGAVGSTTALASLATDAGGTTQLNGGSVLTTSGQSYGDVVTLGAATVLSLSGVGTIGFASTLDGAQSLVVNTGGSTVFGGAVGGVTALASLATDAGGTTSINGGLVRTTGSQGYGDAVTLGASAVLSSSGGGTIGFATTVNAASAGVQSLAVNTGGVTTFGGRVGSTTALASLATDAGGTTQLNGGSVLTTSGQSYGDAVALGAATVLSSSGSGIIGFASTLDGAQSLVVNTGGSTLFGGAVGGVAALASLSTDAGGTTLINGGSVRTTGSQGYGDAVTLGASAVLSSSGGGMIGFATTVNAASAGVQSLAVNTGGVTTFGGAVGGVAALSSLTTDAGGATQLNGGSVSTTGGQSYGDAVALGTAMVLSSTGSGTIGFASTLDGAQSLVVNTGGSTVFGGAVGGVTALASLATDAGGTTLINGGTVRTTGSQGYGNAVTLGASAVLSSSGSGTIGFATTVNAASAGAQSLVVTTGGVTTFGGAVGGVAALSSLTTDAGGTTQLNGGSVSTTGGQSYGDAVRLGADARLTSSGGGGLSFAGTVDGAYLLSLTTGGATRLGGVLGGVTPLTGLALRTGTVGAVSGNRVGTIAAAVASGGIVYDDAAALTVGSVDGLSGIATGTAAATISAGGVLAFATNVAAGDISLTGAGVTQAAGTMVNAGAGTILIDGNDGVIAMAGTLATTNATAGAVRIVDSAGAVLGTIATGAGGGVTLGMAGGDALSGNVAQTAGATISTGTLTGSIGGVATLANAGNLIVTLGAISTNGLALRSGRTGLNVVGPVNAGSGNLALTLDSGALAIQGNLVATSGIVSLVSGGAVGQTGGTIVADTLTGSSTGGVSFTAAGNAIARLAGFTNAGGGGFVLIDSRALAVTGDTTTVGDLTINAAGIDFSGRTVSGTGSLTLVGNGGAVTGGTAAGGTTATVTGASINIGTVRAANGALALTATGAGGAGLTVGTASTTGTATLASQGALGVTQSLTAGTSATLTATGAATLGQTTTGSSLTVTANLITAGATRPGTTLSFTSGGGINLASAQVGSDASFDANGTAALGAVTVGSNSAITVRALDAQITGAQTAARVTFVNRAPASVAFRLGNGTAAGGFALAQDEVNFVNAPTLVFDGGTGNVEMGAMAFSGTAGSKSVSVLATGRIDVTGAVSGNGAGRSFLFGGTTSATVDKASVIEVVAKSTGGGALLLDNADLELRGARIGVGQQPGFLTPIGFDGANGQPVAAVSTAYVGNAASSLYNATFGGVAYTATDTRLVSANTLTVRYTDYALFQNTGAPGLTSGVVLGGTTASPVRNALVLDSGGTSNNAFALFGTINGITGTGTALLGQQVINFTGSNLANTRVNGCLVASGAGCLTSVVSQPVLNVFDASRLNIFQSADDLAVPFDPVVGNNNEALFSGIAVLDGPVADAKCEGSDDPACKASEKQSAAPADEKKPK